MAVAHAMYTRAPSPDALAALGFRPEDFEEELPIAVWPEHWLAYEVFRDCRTQWIHGPGGPTGMNYLVICAELDRLALGSEERTEIMDCIRCLESGALEKIHEDRE